LEQVTNNSDTGLSQRQKGPNMGMEMRCLFLGAFLLILAIVSNGCLTAGVIAGAEEPEFDCFSPSAVYQMTNNGALAFEGMWSNRPMRVYDKPPKFHAYLVIPPKSPAFHYFETNDDLSLNTIKKNSGKNVSSVKNPK
jgi:hypothetical protein